MRPPSRRTLLKGSLVLGAGAVAGCASSPSPEAPEPTTASGSSRTLLAYFSRAGENYYYGDTRVLDVGNTQVVAEMIASTVGVDVFRIEAADPYPQSYRATVERNVREQDADARPAIVGTLPNAATYDAVLVGSPIWNVRPPMIMRTFIENVDLRGKAIFPFVTYAVSGLGRTIDDYTQLSAGATIGTGLAVRGEEARAARTEVEAWLRGIGLRS